MKTLTYFLTSGDAGDQDKVTWMLSELDSESEISLKDAANLLRKLGAPSRMRLCQSDRENTKNARCK